MIEIVLKVVCIYLLMGAPTSYIAFCEEISITGEKSFLGPSLVGGLALLLWPAYIIHLTKKIEE